MLARYREVLAFRKRHPALQHGSIAFVDAPDNVLAFLREGDGERLFCAFNFGDAAVKWDLPAGTGAVELLSGEGHVAHGTLTLAPLGLFVAGPPADLQQRTEKPRLSCLPGTVAKELSSGFSCPLRCVTQQRVEFANAHV